jgi:hypothetical protein
MQEGFAAVLLFSPARSAEICTIVQANRATGRLPVQYGIFAASDALRT